MFWNYFKFKNLFSGNRQRTHSWAGSTNSFGGSSENLVASQSRLTTAEQYKPVIDGSKSHKYHGAIPRDIDTRSSQRSNHRHHDMEQYEYMNDGTDTGGTEMFVRSANDTFNDFVGKLQKKLFCLNFSAVMACSHCPIPQPIQRSIKSELYIIAWRCSYCTETDTNTDSHWVLC